MERLFTKLVFDGGSWKWFRHLLFWIVLYADELLITIIREDGMEDLDLAIIPLLFDIAIVYFNLYVLFPKYLIRKRYILYFLISILTVVFNISVVLSYAYWPDQLFPYPEDFVGTFISTITLLATAVAIKLGKYFYEQKKSAEQFKLEQSKLELNLLKQQVNPHFLFNVLNTIHIQSQTEPKEVSATVLHLSELLRYQIYEAGSSEKVALKKEMDFLKNYLSLEELRRSNFQIKWDHPDHIPNIRITPFLFLPLIENAIKHSKSTTEEETVVAILWDYDADRLTLEVSNTIGDVAYEEEGGFGIENLKKRLDILYGKKYALKMSVKEGIYLSKLELHLK